MAALLLSLFAGEAPAQFNMDPGFGFGGSPFGAQDANESPVEVSSQFVAATEERPAALVIRAKIAPGYHIYSLTQPSGGPVATVINLDPSEAFKLEGDFITAPEPKTHIDHEIWEGLRIEEHMNEVTWFVPISLTEGVDPTSLVITGNIESQACQATTCQPLEFEIDAKLSEPDNKMATLLAGLSFSTDQLAPLDETLKVTDKEPIENQQTDQPLVLILGAALLGGLILNLMPCVLPVIGLKVLSFAEQGGESRGKVLGLNLAYSAGLISVFLVLAALASVAQLGWGELYTFNEFKIGMIVLVFAMALSFLGVWEIPIPGFAGSGKASDLQSNEGFSGAFFKGVFTTVLATPCSGPFLGPVFGATLSQPSEVIFLIFLCVGLGMASPYLLIGIFPGLVHWLPKPGAWMETFKQLMGFVLMATVVYLLSTISRDLYLPMLTTLVAAGLACWWIGRTPLTATFENRVLSWFGGATVAVATGLIAFSMIVPSDKELPWMPYSQSALQVANQDGKTVLVDFTADWCLTCKLNLKRAINTERVKKVVESNNIQPLLADWTDRNDEIKETLAKLGSRSIPLLAIYPADRPNDPIVLRDLISEDQLLTALQDAGAVLDNGESIQMPEIEYGIEMGEVSANGDYR